MEVNTLSSKKFAALTLTLALILVSAGSAFAAFPKQNNPIVPIVKTASVAVVNIDVEKTAKRSISPFPFDDDPIFKRFFGDAFKDFTRSVPMKGRGSGFIVSKDGLILTNNHVVSGMEKITVSVLMADGSKKTYPATIKGGDSEYDLAVIKIEPDGALPVLELGDSDAVEVGEYVVAIGNPYGFEHSVTAGVISAKNRSIHAQDVNFDDFLQTDAAINPGNSGGPLLDMDGKVVGINTAIIPYAQGLGFAIPVNKAKEVMGSLVEKGRVSRGYIGAYINDIAPEVARMYGISDGSGVVISSVMKDSPAEKAGIKAGDIVIELNGTKMKSAAEFRQKVGSYAPGTTVRMKVVRNKREHTITVRLAERPNEDGTAAPSTEQKEISSGSDALKDYGIMRVTEVTDALRERYKLSSENKGLVILEVDANSPASYENGLREGDMLLALNLHNLTTVKDLTDALEEKAEVLVFKLEREGTINYQLIQPKK